MIDHEIKDGLHIVTMNNGANMICPEWQDRMLAVLGTIHAEAGNSTGLVLTGQDKFFCSGLNLDVVMSLPESQWQGFAETLFEVMRKLVSLPCPSVAAINGHAFAGGAFLALACDYRLMRQDRGWFCISEVDVGVPIAPQLMALLQYKLTPAVVRDAVLTGKRFTAEEAVAAGVADGKASAETLMDEAVTLARQLVEKESGIFAALKQTLNAPLLAAMSVSSIAAR